MTEIRVDRSFVPTLSVLRALRSNGIVAMQGDRDFDNTGVAALRTIRSAVLPIMTRSSIPFPWMFITSRSYLPARMRSARSAA